VHRCCPRTELEYLASLNIRYLLVQQNDMDDAPGSYKGASAEGYETTFDRLREMSALSIIDMHLYNHYRGEYASLDSYVGFDAEGSLFGYQGGGQEIDRVAHLKATVENSAAELQPCIYPIGVYGYDCLCWSWYDTGKKKRENMK